MMRSLFVFLAGVMLLCSAFALFTKATWGEPIGVDSLRPAPGRKRVAVQVEVRARKFVLVNEQGMAVGAFGVVDGQLLLMLRDQDKNVRAIFVVDQEGQPRIVFRDENGRPRAQFDIEENESRLMLLDENGKITFKAPQ